MKILIVKNRYKKKLDLKKGLDYFKEKTPITVEYDEIETDFDLDFWDVGNSTFKGSAPCNYYEKLRKIVPEGKYNAVAMIYGNKSPNVSVSVTENVPLYPDTDIITLAKINDGGKTLNHELFHSFFYKLARRGINLNDPMDTYKNDNSLDADIDSNRNDALKLLKPFWSTIEDIRHGAVPIIPVVKPIPVTKKLPIVEMYRSYDDGYQALGNLFYKDFKCSTLERPFKNNKPNISCIPKGDYAVKWTFSTKFLRYTYEVQNVPNRSGIRIHTGNFVTDIAGCILLGFGFQDLNKDGKLDIINSTNYIKQFETLMNKQDFTLRIK